MILQISSGQGPAECELAVGKLLEALSNEYPDIKTIKSVVGSRKDCYKSVLIESGENLSHLVGSIRWVCASPFRPNHKRKNWYIDVSVSGEAEHDKFDDGLVRFETFRSSGKGGQHVNKVETGVRAIYLPLGLVACSEQARSQHMNKKIALDRLCCMIAGMNKKADAEINGLNWLEHTRLERGNPVRTYEGLEFKRTI